MNVAIVGKGGSGKTSISGTMARLLARHGHDVLAVDGDPNPNMALTVGIPAEQINDLPTLPRGLANWTDGKCQPTMSLDEVRAEYAVKGGDGVSLLVMANPQKAGTGWLGSLHAAVVSVSEMASEAPEAVCIIDTDATVEQFLRIAVMRADVILVVVEPFYTSLMAGERMTRLGKLQGYEDIALLANKVRDDSEREQVESFAREHGLEVAGFVPFDDRMPKSEFAESAPIDYDPDTPAVRAIDEIARRLFAEHGRAGAPEAAEAP